MSNIPGPELQTLCEDVQFNCSISDARFARDYSLCIYLLRMREFYRWRFDIPMNQTLDTGTVGDWISEMEFQWDELEEMEFKPVVINGVAFDPFNAHDINVHLQSSDLIYSAGYGRLGQPHFVLAELEKQTSDDSIECYECGKELARDSITMPAMTQDHSIYIRYDSIKRQLWQMLEEWRQQQKPGPMLRVVDHFQLNRPNFSEQNLEQASKQLSQIYFEHERGEVAAGHLLGNDYHKLLQQSAGTRNEFYLRAIRDLLADSLTTWPYLINHRADIELDFWIASVAGARLQLLKASGLMTKLQDDTSVDSPLERLESNLDSEQQLWKNLTQMLVEAHAENSANIDIENQAMTFVQNSQDTLS